MLVDAPREELTLVVDVVAEFVPEPLAVCCDLPVPLAVPPAVGVVLLDYHHVWYPGRVRI